MQDGTFGIVGEKGPEPVIGTSRGAMVLPNSTLKGTSGGEGIGAGGMHVTFGVDVDDDGRLSAYVKNVAQTESATATQAAIKDFRYTLPDEIERYQQNPWRR